MIEELHGRYRQSELGRLVSWFKQLAMGEKQLFIRYPYVEERNVLIVNSKGEQVSLGVSADYPPTIYRSDGVVCFPDVRKHKMVVQRDVSELDAAYLAIMLAIHDDDIRVDYICRENGDSNTYFIKIDTLDDLRKLYGVVGKDLVDKKLTKLYGKLDKIGSVRFMYSIDLNVKKYPNKRVNEISVWHSMKVGEDDSKDVWKIYSVIDNKKGSELMSSWYSDSLAEFEKGTLKRMCLIAMTEFPGYTFKDAGLNLSDSQWD